MRTVFLITVNDLRIFFKERGNWVGIAVLPVIFTLILGFATGNSQEAKSVLVDVLDQDQSSLAQRFLDELRKANSTLVLCPMDNNAADRCGLQDQPLTLVRAVTRVKEDDSSAVIVIPKGFAKAQASFTPVQIDFYSPTAPTTPDPVRQTLDTVLQRTNSAALTSRVADAVLDRLSAQTPLSKLLTPLRAGFVQDVYTQTETLLAQRPPAVRYVTTVAGPKNANKGGFGQSVPGMGSMYVMFTVFGGVAALLRERQRWTLQRLGVLPITRAQLLGGKVLTYFTLGMLQYLVVFGVGLAFGLDLGPHPFLLPVIMVAFVLCCTALALALAPAMRTEGQANAMSQILALALAPLGGAWWPLEIVPTFMQRLGHLSPVAWVMDAFRSLLFYNGNFMTILPGLAVLFGAAVVFFGVGVWRFRDLQS